MTLYRILFLFSLALAGCSRHEEATSFDPGGDEATGLYSETGQEHQVQFEALFRSSAGNIKDLDEDSLISEIKDTTQFLFGPLTYHSLGGIQKGERIKPHLDKATLENGRVMVPYSYAATWMMNKNLVDKKTLRLPLPFAVPDLETPQWQNCTDSAPDHRTWGFFWYFWEPTRPGCDHRLNEQYQEVNVALGKKTPETTKSYPEYARMIRQIDGIPTLSMTFAFGYVSEALLPMPFQDSDFGMREFQKFYRNTKEELLKLGFAETQIHQSDFAYRGSTVIGAKFTGDKQGIRVEVSVVAAAGVDQMDLFAHSFAHNHDGFFGWFGHSRVGSGFDADTLKYKVLRNPQYYSLTTDYQLVYWAGCNSYSYYTMPFFEMKSQLSPKTDHQGTRNLDLIANTLPSLFSFNADNAEVLFQALIHWDEPTTYQSLISQIEDIAGRWGQDVIVAILGDEDNNP